MIFFKMQGLGNDYVYLDCTKGRNIENPKELAIQLSNRNFGVGSDGLILICDSHIADLKMQMWNSDGTEAQMCGNGIRCVAKLAYELGLIQKEETTIETLAGIKHLKLNKVHGRVKTVEVDMGEPIFEIEKIPIKYGGNLNKIENNEEGKIINQNLKILDDKTKVATEQKIIINTIIEKEKLQLNCVSMGNPHAVTFVERLENYPVKQYGRIVEQLEIFPERTNVEFVQIVDKEHIKMRVWERGTGETLACGTGACAAVVESILNGYTDKKVWVELLGGELLIEWKKDNHIYMTGPAVTVFKGEWIND